MASYFLCRVLDSDHNAGNGVGETRVTESTAKTCKEVAGKPFLRYLLDELVGIEDPEIGIVVGHLGDQIVKKIGSEYKRTSLYYVRQTPVLGTGDAVLLPRNFCR